MIRIVHVITVALACDQNMKCVMNIVIPLRVEKRMRIARRLFLDGPKITRFILVIFENQMNMTIRRK